MKQAQLEKKRLRKIWVLWPFQEYFTYIELSGNQSARKRSTQRKTTRPTGAELSISHVSQARLEPQR